MNRGAQVLRVIEVATNHERLRTTDLNDSHKLSMLDSDNAVECDVSQDKIKPSVMAGVGN